MTNFGTCAILALPRMPERQLRFLLALETFPRGKLGWREAGTDLLASTAGLSKNTAVKARGELVAFGLIEYRRGNGAGNFSSYRMPKIDAEIDAVTDAVKVPKNVGYLPPEKVPKQPAKRYPNNAEKVPKRNAVTSRNASGALYALNPYAPAAPGPAGGRDRRDDDPGPPLADPERVTVLVADLRAELETKRQQARQAGAGDG